MGEKPIKIGDKWIGKDKPVFIIAEIGSNHNKNLRQAKKLIDFISEAGADAVKFQIFKAETFYSKKDPMFQVMKENELPRDWVEELSGYTNTKGLIFLASPFDKEAIDLLEKVKSPAIKLASSEAINLPLLRYASSKKRPMLISTGMSNLADIFEAIEVVYSVKNHDVVLLHCTSLYPTSAKDANLSMMQTISNAFCLPVGYSDHTLGHAISIAAVAKGACIIEKHITIDRKLKGPDHSYALEPNEFTKLVESIRDVEQSFGLPIKRMLSKEKACARRKSVIAKVDIPEGTKLTKNLIIIKRPALGIEPRLLKAILGQKIRKTIKKNEAITWDLIE